MFSVCLAILCLLLSTTPAPDTLVICPVEFQPSLAEWTAYRAAQGHELRIIAPPASAEELQDEIQRATQNGSFKYLLLVGDAPALTENAPGKPQPQIGSGRTVATNYAPAKVNVRWGSEPTIASDVPYGDIDGDGLPDLAIGRIPAGSAEELASFLRKVIRYEKESVAAPGERRLNIVAGAGGFGVVADAVIEAAGRHVVQQTVPTDYEVIYDAVRRPTRNSDLKLAYSAAQATPAVGDIRAKIRDQFRGGGLAWIYLGHGLPTELDRVETADGDRPLLAVSDVADIRCGGQSPLAVLVACYTGAFDAESDCLAEKLALAEEGPVAVIAATRVTMPYGNTVLGYEFLRGCFAGRNGPVVLGDVFRGAQRRTLEGTRDDSLRMSLDAVAQVISPPPIDLAAERAEHVLMYHLLGDPLLRLRLAPQEEQVAVPAAAPETTTRLK